MDDGEERLGAAPTRGTWDLQGTQLLLAWHEDISHHSWGLCPQATVLLPSVLGLKVGTDGQRPSGVPWWLAAQRGAVSPACEQSSASSQIQSHTVSPSSTGAAALGVPAASLAQQ